jgi:hypothetical protein
MTCDCSDRWEVEIGIMLAKCECRFVIRGLAVCVPPMFVVDLQLRWWG